MIDEDEPFADNYNWGEQVSKENCLDVSQNNLAQFLTFMLS